MPWMSVRSVRISVSISCSQPPCSLILSQSRFASSWYSVVPHNLIFPPSSFQLPFFTPNCWARPSTSPYLSDSTICLLLSRVLRSVLVGELHRRQHSYSVSHQPHEVPPVIGDDQTRARQPRDLCNVRVVDATACHALRPR